MRKLGRIVRVEKNIEEMRVKVCKKWEDKFEEMFEDWEDREEFERGFIGVRNFERWLERMEEKIYGLSGIDDSELKFKGNVWEMYERLVG